MMDMHVLAAKLKNARHEFMELYRGYEESWLRLLTCTEQADRAAAELAITDIYRAAGLTKEARFFWFDSLPAMNLAYHVMLTRRIPNCLWHLLKSRQELDAVWETLIPSWKALLRDSSGIQIGPEHSLKSSFQSALSDVVKSCSRLAAFERLEKSSFYVSTAPQLSELQMDISWVALSWFGRNVLGSEEGGDPAGHLSESHLTAAQSCLWWCPFEEAVLLCERPSEIHTRDGKLHREGGP